MKIKFCGGKQLHRRVRVKGNRGTMEKDERNCPDLGCWRGWKWVVSINVIHVFLSVLSEDGNRDRQYHSVRLYENRKCHVTQTQDRAVKACVPQPPPPFTSAVLVPESPRWWERTGSPATGETLCHLIYRQRLLLKYLNFLSENRRNRPTESEKSCECANSSIKKLVNRLSSTK